MNETIGAAAISVSGLNKTYGKFEVIKNLDLEIQNKAIHGLVGLNGSGKTTTLECILGLQPSNSGTISVMGQKPEALHLTQGRVVAIFDTPSLHPNLTVRQCLKHASLLCNQIVRTPIEAEQLLGIEQFQNFKIRNLSLGNKRRASIAQALLGKPEVIILDEPFSGLDAEGVNDVLRLITRLNSEENTTFLLSSHQLPYLEQICTDIAILHKGSIAIDGDVNSLLKTSGNQLLLKTPNASLAISVMETVEGVEYSHTDTEGYLHVQMTAAESAKLNQILVEKQIPVAEMILQRGSLGKLFRKITNEEREQL